MLKKFSKSFLNTLKNICLDIYKSNFVLNCTSYYQRKHSNKNACRTPKSFITTKIINK